MHNPLPTEPRSPAPIEDDPLDGFILQALEPRGDEESSPVEGTKAILGARPQEPIRSFAQVKDSPSGKSVALAPPRIEKGLGIRRL
jgi:hypothetical protein